MTPEELQKLRDMFESFKKSDSYEIEESRALFLDTLFNYAFLAGEKSGKEKAVDYILKETGIEADMSLVNDYIIPFHILEEARTS